MLNELTNTVKKHLIADQNEIAILIEQFSLLDTDDSHWTKTYLDAKTGDKWLSFYVDSYLQGNGYQVLGKLPLPDTNELIALALHSNNNDEVFAACRMLSDNERNHKKEFRVILIDQLEKINDRNRQKRVIELTGLDSPLNRRDILGKTIELINSDAHFYSQIAERAKKLV